MLEAINISKSFPGVKALQNVNLTFYPSKVNAILGENGAGKSTLLKVLTGVYADYEGEIKINGQLVKFKNIKEAQKAGIGIIHQELNLIPQMSIAENIFIGIELKNRYGLLDKSTMEYKTSELLKKLKLNRSPKTLVQNLKVGEQQLVEIARALLVNSQIILMDEPTSALTEKEIDNLHVLIQELKTEGKTIVYISHKMEELFRIAEYYTVMRDGKTTGTGLIGESSEQELIKLMVGRDIIISPKENLYIGGEDFLRVSNLKVKHPTLKNRYVLNAISFGLKKGEILGIFGLMGAGRTELLETLFGLNHQNTSGEIIINGAVASIKSPKDAKSYGMAFLTEDRKTEGLVLGMDIASNISLTINTENGLLNRVKECKIAKSYIKDLSIKTPSEKQLCINLSGGNQQKVVLAKWLATNPDILLLDEPTRGIDIKAKSEIYNLINSLADSGKSIVLVSSEITEILALSDRILVMANGILTAEFTSTQANETNLLKAAI